MNKEKEIKELELDIIDVLTSIKQDEEVVRKYQECLIVQNEKLNMLTKKRSELLGNVITIEELKSSV